MLKQPEPPVAMALPCRCCLRGAPNKDLTTPYPHLGHTEIYADMLKDCFDIDLHLGDSRSRGICFPCVRRLRDANNFKLQVQQCQVQLLEAALAEGGSELALDGASGSIDADFDALHEDAIKSEIVSELEAGQDPLAKVETPDDDEMLAESITCNTTEEMVAASSVGQDPLTKVETPDDDEMQAESSTCNTTEEVEAASSAGQDSLAQVETPDDDEMQTGSTTCNTTEVLDDDDSSTDCHVDKKRNWCGNTNMDQRSEIIVLYEAGRNISEIARDTLTTRSTVRRWIRRFQQEGHLENRPKPARKPVIEPSQRMAMVKEYEENCTRPTSHYASLFGVSMETIRRELHKSGLHNRRRAVKHTLTAEEKTFRLDFALKHVDDDWTNVVFTAEKTFKCSQYGHITLGRRLKSRFSKYIPKTEYSLVNMWGWLSAAGPGELIKVPDRLNSVDYVEVLGDTLLPTVRTIYTEQDLPKITLMQEHCPRYRSRVVREWFDLHKRDIKVVTCPPNSPDLNLMENLWGIIVQRWDKQNERTADALEAHCSKTWDDIRGSNLCQNLVDSMRGRLQAVIKQEGGYSNE